MPFFLNDPKSHIEKESGRGWEKQRAIGLIRPVVLEALIADNVRSDKLGEEESWVIVVESGESDSNTNINKQKPKLAVVPVAADAFNFEED